MPKNNKPSFIKEVFFLLVAVFLGAILLIVNAYSNFMNPYLFIGMIVLVALCAAALISILILSNRMRKGNDDK